MGETVGLRLALAVNWQLSWPKKNHQEASPQTLEHRLDPPSFLKNEVNYLDCALRITDGLRDLNNTKFRNQISGHQIPQHET